MTALLYAVHGDRYSCVELILKAGANQDGDVTHSMSPAEMAVTSSAVTSLRLLIQAGCRLVVAQHVEDRRGSCSEGDSSSWQTTSCHLLDLLQTDSTGDEQDAYNNDTSRFRMHRLISCALDLQVEKLQLVFLTIKAVRINFINFRGVRGHRRS